MFHHVRSAIDSEYVRTQRDDGVGAGAGWRGVQLAQEMASINEEAFGWDSVEAAAAYKQVIPVQWCCILFIKYSR